ncbi:3-oxoacyl-[acyl-carrier-protein] synthase III C-terminal domain-containing protein [Undibacterium umbellatum]|uniref:3-oxoacyl-ACP synthase n=1 Tax=Undibacterium umbellatum TaxID=2762300 RepID=A0ABR6ZHS1_9BURK|nr:3-oxoacyl-[acyl-carrier-protein] synthase III C-terminal domain-containing protein [Undibacterium umbellatum]MBC3911270.1 3-oxoacyl-ACP synthase [Undibacterium umbellatum]
MNKFQTPIVRPLAETIGTPIVQRDRRQLLGHATALPGPAIGTEELCERISRNFSIPTHRHVRVIAPRLAVHRRHLCRDFTSAQEAPRPSSRNPELAAQAVSLALNRANIPVSALAYLISHTATPAQLLPGGSAEIARLLGYTGPHVELRQACTGFANALQFAFALTSHADAAPVAIVGVETGSVYFSPELLQRDSSQWINFLQMGDGAAAVIIGARREVDPASLIAKQDGSSSAQKWISHAYFGQCQQAPAAGLRLAFGGSDRSAAPTGPLYFEHDFTSVAKHGAMLLDAGREVLRKHGIDIHQADFIVPHQASGAVAPWLAKYWDIPIDRISRHAQEVGNLGSASIWAALDHAITSRQQVTVSPPNTNMAERRCIFLGAEATQYSYGGFVLED